MPFKLFGVLLRVLEGVPSKDSFFTLMLSGAFRSGLKLNVRWFLKSPGNYISNDHKNIYVLLNNVFSCCFNDDFLGYDTSKAAQWNIFFRSGQTLLLECMLCTCLLKWKLVFPLNPQSSQENFSLCLSAKCISKVIFWFVVNMHLHMHRKTSLLCWRKVTHITSKEFHCIWNGVFRIPSI